MRTAGSIFSPDEGGPLKRRKRERFPTTVETYTTRVTGLVILVFDLTRAFWGFNMNITTDGPNSPELKIDGQSPISVFQQGPTVLRVFYDFDIQADYKYAIDETPTNLIFDPPCLVPQSGDVEIN